MLTIMCADCVNKTVWKTKCTSPKYLWYILSPGEISEAEKALDTMRCHVVADIGLDEETMKKFDQKKPVVTEQKLMSTKVKSMEMDIYRRIVASKEYAADDAIFVNQYKTGTEVDDTGTEQDGEQEGGYRLFFEDIIQLLQPAGQSTEFAS
jgi:hypothetical protein